MDEVASLQNARAFGRDGLGGLAASDHIAPLHSIMLWLVTFGSEASESLLRLPSLVFGVMTVPAFAWIVFDMFRSAKFTAIATALICVSPYAIWHSQEARMYAPYLFFSVVFVALSWRAARGPFGSAIWVAMVCFATLGLYTHHFMAFLIGSFGLYFFARDGLFNPRAWSWALGIGVAAILFSYWIYLTADKINASAGTAKPSFVLWVPYTLLTFSLGQTLGPSIAAIRGAGIASLISSQGALAGLGGLCVAYLMYQGMREVLKHETRAAGIWCVAWMGIPVFLGTLATQISNITYNPRYVIVSLPPVLIILASGMLASIRSGGVGRGVVVVFATLTSIALANLYWNPAYAREEVRPLARMLESRAQPEPLVVVDNSRIWPVLMHYGANVPSQALQLEPSGARSAPNLNVVAAALEKVIKRPGAKIWLIQYRPWEADPDGVLQKTLDGMSQLKEVHSWPGVTLRVYDASSRQVN